MKDNNQKNLKYGHVGRPTNEEVKEYNKKKNTKIIIAALLVFVLVGGLFLFLNKDTISFSTIMGNSSSGKLTLSNYVKRESLKTVKKTYNGTVITIKNSELKNENIYTNPNYFNASENCDIQTNQECRMTPYYFIYTVTIDNTKGKSGLNYDAVVFRTGIGEGSSGYLKKGKKTTFTIVHDIRANFYEDSLEVHVTFDNGKNINLRKNIDLYKNIIPNAHVMAISDNYLHLYVTGRVLSVKIDTYKNNKKKKSKCISLNYTNYSNNMDTNFVEYNYKDSNPYNIIYYSTLYEDKKCKSSPIKTQKFVVNNYR